MVFFPEQERVLEKSLSSVRTALADLEKKLQKLQKEEERLRKAGKNEEVMYFLASLHVILILKKLPSLQVLTLCFCSLF